MACKSVAKPYIWDPIVAEALTAWVAVDFCKSLQIQQMILEGDSLVVVKALRCKEMNSSRYGQLTDSAKSALNSFQLWQIEHVKRDANKVAHRLAKEALLQPTYHIWRGCAPQFIHDLVILECYTSNNS
eukprot:TRINITY_DN26824_c1_g1_i3.p1 TRINITY_DN26824_c1_g1~~TRINITY_DN26824_c1_g1_i3.p1  ORF type:complete len:129 (-),score=11.04 TRINITY_DN26824_c1_g1_i3:427-813(-)